MKVVYTLQPGETYAFYDGKIVVVHPDRPPIIVYTDGSIEVVELLTAEPEPREPHP
jgi:hypothetical protein